MNSHPDYLSSRRKAHQTFPRGAGGIQLRFKKSGCIFCVSRACSAWQNIRNLWEQEEFRPANETVVFICRLVVVIVAHNSYISAVCSQLYISKQYFSSAVSHNSAEMKTWATVWPVSRGRIICGKSRNVLNGKCSEFLRAKIELCGQEMFAFSAAEVEMFWLSSNWRARLAIQTEENASRELLNSLKAEIWNELKDVLLDP